MAKKRDKGRRQAKGESLPSVEELNIQTQRISPGFYPGRAVEPDRNLSPEERIQKAKELSRRYQKIDEPVPAAIGVLC